MQGLGAGADKAAALTATSVLCHVAMQERKALSSSPVVRQLAMPPVGYRHVGSDVLHGK